LGLDDEQAGYLLMKAVSEMPSRRHKFLSKVKNPIADRSANNMRRKFMKAVRAYFAAVSELPEMEPDSITVYGGHSPHPSIEGTLFSEFAEVRRNKRESGAFFRRTGRRLKTAEEVYYHYASREGENYAVEYRTLLRALWESSG
jgi:hypothetical protein